MPDTEIHARRGPQEIVADAGGLRWRRSQAEDWQSAHWDEVTDFYLEPPGNDAGVSTTRFAVHFRDGRTLPFSASWGNWHSLCDAIALRSPNAHSARMPDGAIQWVAKGLRPVDLPVSFAYSLAYIRQVKARRTRTTVTLAALTILLPPLALLLLKIPGPVGAFLPAVIFPTVFVFLIPTIIRRLFRMIREGKQYKEALRRVEAGERFEVTADTLTFWQNGENYRVP